jgi:hypothetical protein
MQENVSRAGELPKEEQLQTSVRQRASGIEGYGVSITLSFDVDSIGWGHTDGEPLYGNISSTSYA